jgi:hypothetical protein
VKLQATVIKESFSAPPRRADIEQGRRGRKEGIAKLQWKETLGTVAGNPQEVTFAGAHGLSRLSRL